MSKFCRRTKPIYKVENKKMGKEKKRKRHRSSSSSPSSSSDDERKLKKLKKKLKKEQRRSEKILKKKIKTEQKKLASQSHLTTASNESVRCETETAADIPVELMERSKAMAPMTKAEWDERQSVVRRVFDEDSGRYRLIKGDGEVLEEIVSRDRHKQINQQATHADGAFFRAQTVDKKRSVM